MITLRKSAIKKMVPARKKCAKKGDNGKVLIVGGSYIYHGAPVLSSLAALRSGADLVYTSVPSVMATPVRSASPSLIVIPLADQKITRGAAIKLLGQAPSGLDSAAIGMGLGIADTASLVYLIEKLIRADVRLVLDAEALRPEVLSAIPNTNSILTPHIGEFKRLFGILLDGDIRRRAAAVKKAASEHHTTILLKGPTDIISDGKTVYLNTTGTPAMTAGGTGDVLAGIAAGLLARNRNSLDAASAAAYFNGLAGMAAQKKMGQHIISSDLCDIIPGIIKPFDRITQR